MKNENLNGSLVLVQPGQGIGSGKMPGQIGVLTYARSASENYVRFMDGGEAHYQASEILKLKDKQQVFDDLTKNGTSMPVNDFKAMYKIMLLQDRGTSQSLYAALAIARDNPGLQNSVLEPIIPAQKQQLDKTIGR